jgi:hypothetical protein
MEPKSTVQVEDTTTRVTRWDLPPGACTGPHVHEFDYVVVPLTDSILTVTTPEGERIERSRPRRPPGITISDGAAVVPGSTSTWTSPSVASRPWPPRTYETTDVTVTPVASGEA